MTTPQQVLSDEQIVAAMKACDKEDHTKEGWIWRTRIKWARAIESATLKAVSGQEPIGYFRSLPFGWEDCAEFDEGAMPLFALPPAQPAPVDELVKALQLIADWSTHTTEFAVDYGSNGVRDFYRGIARAALQGVQAPQATKGGEA